MTEWLYARGWRPEPRWLMPMAVRSFDPCELLAFCTLSFAAGWALALVFVLAVP